MRALPALAAVLFISLAPPAPSLLAGMEDAGTSDALPDASPVHMRPAHTPESAPAAAESMPPMPVLASILLMIAGGALVFYQRMRALAG